jgi:hypothetical protein
LALALVHDLRDHRAPVSEEDLADFETDVLAGFVLARASAGLADSTIRNDTGHLELIWDWFGRPLREMQPGDTTAAIRAWIDRRAGELPAGFGRDVRAWLVTLLDGDARTRPRSHATLRVHFGRVRPFIQCWAATRSHLRGDHLR